MGVRAQGPPGTAALTGHLHTRGGCGAASGFGFPASPSVFVYLWMRRMGLARLCLRVHEFTAQNKQHPTQLCARCRHRRGSWAGNGSVYLHTPASCWESEGGSHTALPCAHCDPQGMVSPCPGTPGTTTPFPCVPWFVCPGPLHGHTVGQAGPGASCGHSVGTVAPGAVQGLGGLDWGSCAGAALGPWGSYTGIVHGVHGGAALRLGWGLN